MRDIYEEVAKTSPTTIAREVYDFGAVDPEIVALGKKLFQSWYTATDESLRLLWSVRKELLEKGGEPLWREYHRYCYEDIKGPSFKTINSHLDRFEESGFTKPKKLTFKTVSDRTKFVVKGVKQVGDVITVDLYLPEKDMTYTQTYRI